jgi:hypothetical protein
LRGNLVFKEQWSKFRQCMDIHLSFEINNFLYRVPVINPAPAIEFWYCRFAEIQRILSSSKAQQEPALPLTYT